MSIALGERLHNLRKARGLSQEEVARRTNIGVKAYRDLERGRTLDPHYSTLEGLAHALGITVVELVGEESEPVLAGPKVEAPWAGRLVDLPQVREWLSAQDAVFVAMSKAEFVDVVAQIESLEELQELYGEILKERGRIEKVLEKPDLGKELFPAIGIKSLPTKRERVGEAMRPSRNAWQLRQEIGRLYRALEQAIENYSMYLFNEGKTEDFLIHPRRIATMPESTRRALADVRRETFTEVLAGVGA
jgi:transcriptional regulator with XRE-family HTH domain